MWKGSICISREIIKTLHRKIELVEYARSTRLLFIRLLALVKWASSAGNLSKCDVSCWHEAVYQCTQCVCVHYSTPVKYVTIGGVRGIGSTIIILC